VREYAGSFAGEHSLVDLLLEGGKWSKEAATLGMILESVRSTPAGRTA